MMPKALLRPCPRGGATRRDQAALYTARRCQRWLEGEREELWEDTVEGRPRRQHSGNSGEDDEEAQLLVRHARLPLPGR